MADEFNPYNAPLTGKSAEAEAPGYYDPATLKKIEAVVRDAEQF